MVHGVTVVRRGPLDALRQRLRPGSQRTSSTKAVGPQAPVGIDNDKDTFERDGAERRDGSGRSATFSTKRAGYTASQVFCGAEFAFKVNHVDPLNEGRKDVKLAWVSDGSHGLVDLESALWRGRLGTRGQFEIQGPGIQAKADDDTLPIKIRFAGLAFAQHITSDMPGDETPPRIELKVEVKLTDKSVASLAALAGATDELTGALAALSGSATGALVADALLVAIPVISGAVAVASARRAIGVIRDDGASRGDKALAVARALADATAVVFPLAGTIANISLVLAAVGLAKMKANTLAKTAHAGGTNDVRSPQAPPTGPPKDP